MCEMHNIPPCTALSKCVKFACNYFKNSSDSGGFVPHTAPLLDPAGELSSTDPLWFCPSIPNLLPPPMVDKRSNGRQM